MHFFKILKKNLKIKKKRESLGNKLINESLNPQSEKLKFHTCKMQGALIWKNQQIDKLHGFKLRQKLGFLKSKRKTKQINPKGKLKVWMGV